MTPPEAAVIQCGPGELLYEPKLNRYVFVIRAGNRRLETYDAAEVPALIQQAEEASK